MNMRVPQSALTEGARGCSISPDLETLMATFDEFIGSLEKEFGETGKGKPFEIFCKWFLENDPEWSNLTLPLTLKNVKAG